MMHEWAIHVHLMTQGCYNAIFIYFCYRMSRRLEPTDVAAIEKVRAALSHSSSHSSNTLQDHSTLDDPNLDPLHADLLLKDKITSIGIVGHQLVPIAQEKRQFASYEVEVSTVELSYRVSRRFSEFHQLYREARKILNLKCEFPKKVYNPFVSSTSPAIVEQRSSKLHFFLKELLNHVRTSRDAAVTVLLFNFLAIKEHYEQKQLSPNYKKCNSEKLAYYRMISMKPTLSEGLTPTDQNTLEFKLALLASNGSGDKCLKDIEELLKARRNKLSLEEIKMLFVGDGQCPGLLRYGLSNSSETNRIIALEILLGVLLPQRNPQNQKYQRALQRLLTEEWRVREISMLENAQFKVLYFRLLSLYCERVEREYARPEKTVLQDLFLFHRDLLNDYSAWKKVHEGEMGLRQRLRSEARIDHARKIELTEFQEDKEELVSIFSCEEPLRRAYVSQSNSLLVFYLQIERELEEKELFNWSRYVSGVSVDEYTSMVRATLGLGRKKISLRVQSVKPNEAASVLQRHKGVMRQVMELQEAKMTEDCDWVLLKEEYPVEFESQFDEIIWVKREQGCSKMLVMVHFAAGLAGTNTSIDQVRKDMLDDLALRFPA